MTPTPAEGLRAAAHEIEKGWVKGQYATGEGMCALGALSTAFLGNPFFEPSLRPGADGWTEYTNAATALAQVMKEQYPAFDRISLSTGKPEAVIAFTNDQLAKEKAEIISCMEKAALSCEEGL